jgi:hypothetical protein
MVRIDASTGNRKGRIQRSPLPPRALWSEEGGNVQIDPYYLMLNPFYSILPRKTQVEPRLGHLSCPYGHIHPQVQTYIMDESRNSKYHATCSSIIAYNQTSWFFTSAVNLLEPILFFLWLYDTIYSFDKTRLAQCMCVLLPRHSFSCKTSSRAFGSWNVLQQR